jgi:hypothetical protein
VSKLEKFLARWLARRIVRQGPHERRIAELYGVIYDAAADEFVEDNAVTLHSFLRGCFDAARAISKDVA